MPAIPQFSATVFSADTAAVRDFYVDVLALDVASDIGWFTSLRGGDGTWEVCIWDPRHESVPDAARATAEAGVGPMLAFVVDDVDAVARQAAAHGHGATVLGPAVDEPWGQRHVFVRDPAGTIVDVVQVIAPDPAWLAAHGIDPATAPTPT